MAWMNGYINQKTFLRIIIAVVGGIAVLLGINVAFGGIQTLGWQIPTGFVTIVNEEHYAVQDNHVRYLGGFFGAAGIFMLIATTNLERYQSALRVIFLMFFVGGLARLSAQPADVVFSADLITSFLAEVILMPVLVFWLPRALSPADAS
jgi:hypothetical protein